MRIGRSSLEQPLNGVRRQHRIAVDEQHELRTTIHRDANTGVDTTREAEILTRLDPRNLRTSASSAEWWRATSAEHSKRRLSSLAAAAGDPLSTKTIACGHSHDDETERTASQVCSGVA